jgi:hypothetical protein
MRIGKGRLARFLNPVVSAFFHQRPEHHFNRLTS